MIRALILDAGQVLVRSARKDQWNIPPRAREIIGARADVIDTPEWEAACKKESLLVREDVVIAGEAEEYRMRRAFVAAVNADLKGDLTEDEISALAHDLTDNPARYIWYDDVRPVLGRLKGRVKLAVLSDAMPSVRRFVSLFDTDGLFDEVLLSSDIGATKPDERMYREMLRRLGLKGEECLFVDDRPCNLEGARRCGMKTAQMLRFDDMTAEDEPAVYGLDEVEEIVLKENGWV